MESRKSQTPDTNLLSAVERLIKAVVVDEQYPQWRELCESLGSDCEVANVAARLILFNHKEDYLSLRRAMIEHEGYYKARARRGEADRGSD